MIDFEAFESEIDNDIERISAGQELQIFVPRPGRQAAVMNCGADMIGYGGEAGSNKSYTTYGLAYLKHDHTIMFRSEFSQMTNSVIPKGKMIFGGVADWKGATEYTWWFHKGGRLKLGALKNQGDFERYTGNEWDAMVFDEAAQLREDEVMSVLAWMRGDETKGRQQAYFFFNPPRTVKGRWIIDRFAPWIDRNYPDPAAEGEWRWYGLVDGKETIFRDDDERLIRDGHQVYLEHEGERIYLESRTFFFADRDENPELGARYEARLDQLPTTLRRQLKDGDFMAGLEDGAWQIFEQRHIKMLTDRWKPMAEFFGDTQPPELTVIGCDPARGGANRTVIGKRYNEWVDEFIIYPGSETPTGGHVAQLILKEMDHLPNRDEVMVFVDVGGIGASPYDALVAAGVNVVGVNAGSRSEYRDKSGLYEVANKRTELLLRLLRLCEGHPVPLAVPPCDELFTEMPAVDYSMPQGKILAQSKDEIKEKTGGVSTDVLDCLALTAMGPYD